MNQVDELLKSITVGYRRQHFEDQLKQPDSPIRGSSALKCRRELALRASGEHENPPADDAIRMWECGHDREGRIAEALRRAGWTVDTQVAVHTGIGFTAQELADEGADEDWSVAWERVSAKHSPNLVVRSSGEIAVRSRLDMVLRRGRKDECAIECKSVGAFPFVKAREGKPQETRIAQVMLQHHGLVETYGVDVPFYLLHEARDGDRRKGFFPFELELSPVDMEDPRNVVWLEEAKQIFRQVLIAEARDELSQVGPSVRWPERKDGEGVLKKGPWQCDYCSIGPERGGCWPALELVDQGEPGHPQWNQVGAAVTAEAALDDHERIG